MLDSKWSGMSLTVATSHCRVVLTPHVAGVTELSYKSMAKVVAAEARRISRGLPPTVQLNSIDLKGA